MRGRGVLDIDLTFLLKFSGMLRKYLKKNQVSGILNSKLGKTLNDCEITSQILESIDGGDDGKGNMVIIR